MNTWTQKIYSGKLAKHWTKRKGKQHCSCQFLLWGSKKSFQGAYFAQSARKHGEDQNSGCGIQPLKWLPDTTYHRHTQLPDRALQPFHPAQKEVLESFPTGVSCTLPGCCQEGRSTHSKTHLSLTPLGEQRVSASNTNHSYERDFEGKVPSQSLYTQ